jgi:hypothetical protein
LYFENLICVVNVYYQTGGSIHIFYFYFFPFISSASVSFFLVGVGVLGGWGLEEGSTCP